MHLAVRGCSAMRISLVFALFLIFLPTLESTVYIIDESGKTLRDVVGPIDEGSRLSLLCESNGGVPSIVTWWKDSYLLDDSFVTMSKGVVRNELTFSYLDRGDLMSTLTCQSALPNATEAAETSNISLDMNLKPLNIHITSLQRPLSAGRKVILRCQSAGSRPPALITWWIGSRQLFNSTQVTYSTTTISKLIYVPMYDDHGRVLSCRATNPVMNGNILEDHRMLNIHYIPQLSITVGTPKPFIVEGDVVYFDCNIEANPAVTEIGWRFNDNPLYSDIKAGIKVENSSLLLKKISRNQSGNYSCGAANAEGEGFSENVAIDVQYIPYCAPNQKPSYGTPLREAVSVECIVEAKPEEVEFLWFLNNTFRQIPLKTFTVNGTMSTLQYTPKRESDYGNLMCVAKNSIGQQSEACCFKVTPAFVPNPVEDCTVSNETLNSAIIQCKAGFDGGLSQEFHIELYSNKGLVDTAVEPELPEFVISDLPSGTSFIAVVFAMNDLGRSNAVAFNVKTKAKPRAEGHKFEPISPLLAVLIFVISSFVLTAIIIMFCSKHWSAKLGEDLQQTPSAWEQAEIKPEYQYI